MNVPFVDLPRQIAPYMREVEEKINDVIYNRADFIMRQDLIDFEKSFAKFCGTKHCIGVANGSDALNLTLKALDIGIGDEVITVSHTFVATIAAIVHSGATPILIDVTDDYNMDVGQIEKLITKRTKAIMPVHLNGRMCEMDAILDLAKKHNIYVVEDSAQGIGAMYNGKKSGSFGIMSTNSFYPFKTLGCFGDGGAITTNSDELNYKLRCLRDNGQDREKGDILYWGWNSRLDNLQAAILSIMLKHLPQMIDRRRAIAKLYTENLKDVSGLSLPKEPVDKGSFYDSFQNYVIATPKRDELVAYLNKNNIGTLISWPVPTHFHKGLKLDHFSLPVTELLSKTVVSLPMHPGLTDDEVEYVISVTKSFFNN